MPTNWAIRIIEMVYKHARNTLGASNCDQDGQSSAAQAMIETLEKLLRNRLCRGSLSNQCALQKGNRIVALSVFAS